MPLPDLGFLSSPPTCSPFNLGNDYFTNFAINSVVSNALTSILDERYVNALQEGMFFCSLKKFILYDAILDKWMFYVVNNLAKVIMFASVTYVTMWVVMAGIRIMSGVQREPIIVLMFQGAKIVFVMSLISALTSNTDTVIHTVLGLERAITQLITGSSLTVDRLIDMNLAVGQFMNMVVEDVTNSVADQSSKRGAFSVFAGALGQVAPAALTSLLVMLAQIAICFALMLSPLFLFFLLFKGTASMFWRWLKFLFSTFVALAFLSIVSTIAMSTTVSYGLMIALSMVLNSAADGGGALGTLAELAIRVLTGNLSPGSAARVDMGGSASNLAAMGAMFSVLIVATPPLIKQLFDSSMGYASNLMGAMGAPRAGLGGGQPGAGGNAIGNNPAAGVGGAMSAQNGSDHSASGAMARQILNHANSSNRQDGASGTSAASPVSLAGTRGYLSQVPGLEYSPQDRQNLYGKKAPESAEAFADGRLEQMSTPVRALSEGSPAVSAPGNTGMVAKSPQSTVENTGKNDAITDARVIKEQRTGSTLESTQQVLSNSRPAATHSHHGHGQRPELPYGNRHPKR